MSDDPAAYFLVEQWGDAEQRRAEKAAAAGDLRTAQYHLGKARAYLNVRAIMKQPTDEQRRRYGMD